MRFAAILLAITGVCLLVDATAGAGTPRWCAELASGAAECGLRTQTRCLQLAQRGAGTCRKEEAVRADLRPAILPVSTEAKLPEG